MDAESLNEIRRLKLLWLICRTCVTCIYIEWLDGGHKMLYHAYSSYRIAYDASCIELNCADYS